MYSQKKRQNNYYGQKQNKKKRNFVLEPGLKGFLCTCNFREKDCIKEAYNILNEYADKLYEDKSKHPDERAALPPEENKSGENAEVEEDIDDALAKELSNLKQEQNWRKPQKFQVVESGANNCLFIKTTLENPIELAHCIMKDVYETKMQKSRFLLRLVPIEATCKAYMDEIQKCAAVLFDKYFSKEGKTFAVVFNYRNNSSISRTTVIEEFAEMIKMRNVNNRVDLSQPELTVIVEVIRSMCCLSVVPDYFKLLKYNLLELCGKGEKAKLAHAKAEAADGRSKEEGGEGDSGEPKDEGGTVATEEAKGEVAATEEAKGDVAATEEAKGEVASTEEAKGEVASTEEAKGEVASTEEAKGEEAATEEAKGEEAATEEAEGEPKVTGESLETNGEDSKQEDEAKAKIDGEGDTVVSKSSNVDAEKPGLSEEKNKTAHTDTSSKDIGLLASGEPAVK